MASMHSTRSLTHFKWSRCLGSNRLFLAQIFQATASKNSLVVAPFKQSSQPTENQMFSSLVSYIPHLFAVVCIRCFFLIISGPRSKEDDHGDRGWQIKDRGGTKISPTAVNVVQMYHSNLNLNSRKQFQTKLGGLDRKNKQGWKNRGKTLKRD